MKRTIFIISGVLILIIALNFREVFNANSKEPINLKSFPKDYGMMNPQKRVDREIKMLADPATGKIPKGIRAKELAFAQSLPTQGSGNRGAGYNWKEQGPYNVGGRTRAAAFDINNENILIAGGNTGAVYRSTDGGSNWLKTETPYLAIGASCITQDTRVGKTDTWYIGTGERYSSAAGGGAAYWLGNGILKSIDNGLTWDTLGSTISDSPQSYNTFDKVWNIALDPSTTSDDVYVATNKAIYKSTDGGESFTSTLASANTGSYSYSDILCTPNGVLYATFGSDGASKGIWRSEDGDTWNAITPAEIGSNYNRIVLCYDPQNENTLYFFANSPGVGHETVNFRGTSEWNSLLKYEFISGDGSGTGGNWTNLSANLPIGPYLFDDLNVQGSYDMLIRVKPDDSNTIIIGGTNLYRSTDAFSSADNTTMIGGYKEDTELPLFETYPNHHPDNHTAFFSNANPEIMYSGNDGGLMKTSDINASTVVWESLNQGYITSMFYTVAIDHGTDGSNTIIGGLQDNGTQFTNSADQTADWTMSFSYDGAYCAIPDGANEYYMSIQSGRMAKLTLDNDGNLINYRRIDPQDANPDAYDFINPFIMDPVNNNIIYLSNGNTLWRNDDLNNIALNNEWDSITQGWTQYSATAAGNISSFGVTYSGSDILYIGTDNGKIYKLTDASTTDASFNLVSTGISGYVSSISVDPRDDNKLMAVISNYNTKSIYYSENGGTDWWRVSGNLEGEPTHAIAPETYTQGPYPSCRWGEIIPTPDGGTVYLVGTSVGLFATDRLILGTDYETDKTRWTQQSPDLIGNSIVTMMDYRESDGFIAVATHGAGVFTSNITTTWQMSDIKDNEKSLFNIYPNPANNYLNIEIENNNAFNYIIYDIAGKTIKQEKNASTMVDVSSLNKGTYFIEIIAKDQSIGKKEFIKL